MRRWIMFIGVLMILGGGVLRIMRTHPRFWAVIAMFTEQASYQARAQYQIAKTQQAITPASPVAANDWPSPEDMVQGAIDYLRRKRGQS
jgi:hypothetical protein